MKQLIRRYPIWSFLVINYLISWTFLYPSYQLILQSDGIPPLAFIGLIGAYGPTIAALIVQAVVDGRKVRELLRRIIRINAAWQIYALIILAPVILYLSAQLLAMYLHGAAVEPQPVSALAGLPFWILAALPFGPMGEELGWRGFLLPRLLQRYSLVKSTVLTGLAWGVWHLASFTFPGAALPEVFAVSPGTILLFVTYTISLSFMFTYVHLKGRGSVLLAILLHAFFNAASNVTGDFYGDIADPSVRTAYILFIVLAGLAGYALLRRSETQHPA
ncbi:MAG: type II CAAX endopeptidase family protein [Saprospiraceae bacterium]|nr:type II CAAX endopeptidase family protein [Saprospiraceae bacterium]